jgi:hypothetical protein
MWKGENFGVGPPEKYVLKDSGIMDGYIIHPFKLFSTIFLKSSREILFLEVDTILLSYIRTKNIDKACEPIGPITLPV